ncbi:MAG: helix-turn-helix domain-containing protein [Minisyncoccia bacterium]
MDEKNRLPADGVKRVSHYGDKSKVDVMVGLNSSPVASVTGPVAFFDNQSVDSAPTIEQLLTIGDVARFFNVSPTSVRRILDQRRMRFRKVGRSVRFTQEDVDSYLDENSVESIG